MNKHFVRIYDCKLQRKPDNKKEGYIYKRLSEGIKKAEPTEVTLNELMPYATNGAIFQVGQLEKNKPTVEEKRDLKELLEMNELDKYQELQATIKNKTSTLAETSLIVIDVDNELGNVNPKELIEYIKPHCYYYTFSHNTMSNESGTNQNALRLIFELDRPVKKELANFIEEAITHSIKQQFPFIDKAGGEVVGLQSKTFIFGSQHKEYQVFDREPLEVEKFEKVYLERKDIDDLIRLTKINNNTAVDNNELIDMAQFLANKGVYLDDYDKWAGLALGVFHTAKLGLISDDLALEILMTYDQRRQPEQEYLKFKSDNEVNNPATIGTFIKLATDNGYKRKQFNSDEEIEIDTRVETLPIDSYLNVDDALKVLKSKEKRILIDSPTGTGKTYSFIEALKVYLKENQDTICYFAMPTRALSTQPTETYGLGTPLMGNVTPKRAYQSALMNVELPFVVGTYDKAKMFADNFKHKKIIVIADEAHKEVLDYDYRAPAINGLFNLKNADNVIKFIGLSGTPQEIDLTQYDKVIKIEQQLKREVFKKLDIVTYEKGFQYIELTTQIILQEVSSGNKVLLFINNKKVIKKMQRVLKDLGIKASTVASKENLNKSKTYRYIMEHEKFPDNADVLIATTVIADGINIKNDSENYICMVAPHYQLSPLFNASTIKQASNRFRNPYKKMIIPFQISENVLKGKRDEETRLFNFEWKYQSLLQTAEGVAKYAKARFNNNLNEYTPSIIERVSGLYYQNPYFKDDIANFNLERALQEERKKNARLTSYDSDLVDKLNDIRKKLFTVDPRVIRQRTSEAQEKYYQYFPYAFIKQLELFLEKEAIITNEKLYASSISERKMLEKMYEKIEEAEALDEKEKHEKLPELLTEYLYEGYYMERQQGKRDGIFFNTIESVIAHLHFKVLPDLIDHCTHEEAIHLMQQVERPADIHKFKNYMNALITWEEFSRSKKNPPTKVIINLLRKELTYDTKLRTHERDNIYRAIAKKMNHKFNLSDIKKIANRFILSDEKSKKNSEGKNQRFRTNFRMINLADIATTFKMNEESITRIYYSMGGKHLEIKNEKKLVHI